MCSAEAGAIARTQAVWRATLRQARECECPAAVSGGGGWGFQRVTDIERRCCGRRAKLCLSRTAIPPKTSSSRHPKQRAPTYPHHRHTAYTNSTVIPIPNHYRLIELSACDAENDDGACQRSQEHARSLSQNRGAFPYQRTWPIKRWTRNSRSWWHYARSHPFWGVGCYS